jgi:HEAT repeat protein
MFSMFCLALSRGLAWRKQALASAANRPGIQQALLIYLAGSNEQSEIRRFMRISRWDVADGILAFQGAVGGGARDRLCELALDLSLVQYWCQDAHSPDPVFRRKAFARLAFVCTNEPCRRVAGDLLVEALEDPDAEVRLSAARALVQSGGADEIATVFDLAVSQSLLIRILLSEELRRYALPLCEKAVPQALASGDTQRILATLEMLVAWERAIPLHDLRGLVDHADRKVRVQALRLVPLVPVSPEHQAAVLKALEEADPEVATAAARAAGRLRIEASLPLLSRCLRQGTPGLARTAAMSMVEIGPRGIATLEELGSGQDPVAAGVALEALVRARRKAGA